MIPGSLRIHRATVDDLPALKALWQAAGLPANELESRLTEFQVIEADDHFVGAAGVQIVRQHIRFYAEDFADFSRADSARELFWDRLQTLAANHGVFRIWTQETSPFWTHWGFQPAGTEILERLPEEWKYLAGNPGAPEPGKGGWLSLELKNEDKIQSALGNQVAGFMDEEKKHTAAVAAKARRLRIFFTIVFFAIGIICFAIALWLLLRHPLAVR